MNDLVIPEHVAIIMDGNGRWANSRGLARNEGHKAGVDALEKTVMNCMSLGIKILSVYAFSTENWIRPKSEVGFLMDLLLNSLASKVKKMHQNGVKIVFLGEREGLSQKLVSQFEKSEALTRNNTSFRLNILFNYGSRNEILAACEAYADLKQTNPELILTEDVFSNLLYTKDCPDPEVLIRTSGECRVSNFLLWQISYSEFFFVDVFWPDFDKDALTSVIQEYSKRNRRFGGLS